MPAAGWLSTISLSARLCPHRGGHGGACRMAFRLGSRDSAGTPTSRPALISESESGVGVRRHSPVTPPRSAHEPDLARRRCLMRPRWKGGPASITLVRHGESIGNLADTRAQEDGAEVLDL